MKYWKRVDAQNKTTTVESYSYDLPIPGAIEIDKAKFDAFITTLEPPPYTPPRNLAVEFDALKAQLVAKSII